MTPQELKNSILQLAIQGKLVEQRPEEGTAEELFRQIQKEKQALIKAGKIKKEKPLPEITEDEIPFEIPESWKWIRVRDVISTRAGLAYDKTNLSIISNNMVRVLRGGNILDMRYTTKSDDVMISCEFVNTELFLKKNMLVTPAVTSLEHVGKMGRIEKDYDDMVVGGFVLMLMPHLNHDILSLFLLYAFSSKYFRDYCRSIVNKSGQAFYNLSREKMLSLSIPLPPLAEQKRIVAKIEELLPYIDRYEKAWNRLEDFNKRFPADMQKSILQLAIQGKLVEQRPEEGTAEELYRQIQKEKQALIRAGKIKKEKPLPEITDDEIPFDIPESWKWVRLTDIVSIRGGKRIPKGEKLSEIPTRHIYIRVTDMQNGTIIDNDLHYISDNVYSYISQYIIRESDVYVVIVGSTIGKVGLVPSKFDGMNLTENAARLIPIIIDKKYLYYVLSTNMIQSQFLDKTKQVGQPKLALFRLESTKLPLPPLAEQKRIVAKLEKLLPLCERLQ